MKREFLNELGLNDEQVEKVMQEHGKTVNALKDDADKAKELERQVQEKDDQLKERDEQLDTLKTKAAGNEELQKQIETLQNENESTKSEYQKKLEQQAFTFALERKLANDKARSPKAVKAFLDTDKMKLDGDDIIGYEEQIKPLKESEAWLFDDGKPSLGGRNPNPTQTPPTPIKGNPWKRGEVNLSEQHRILSEDRNTARTLIDQAGLNPADYGL